MSQQIKLLNAALDEKDGELILAGRIANESLAHLKVASYQREAGVGKKIRELSEALQHSGVPAIQLGLRGGNFTENKGTFLLLDPTYIIDGLQRTTAARELIEQGLDPWLRAEVRFNTTYQTEEVLFKKWNTTPTRLSGNILLRNECSKHSFLRLLFDLTYDSSFCLYNRVAWNQQRKPTELINGTAYVSLAARLHRHFGLNVKSYRALKVLEGMSKLVIGRNAVRENVKNFWTTVDAIWNVRDINDWKSNPPHMGKSFLMALTEVFNDHTDFWSDTDFFVTPAFRSKLQKFNLRDPATSLLCKGGGNSPKSLYLMLVDHLNSSKQRKNFLQPFDQPKSFVLEDEEE